MHLYLKINKIPILAGNEFSYQIRQVNSHAFSMVMQIPVKTQGVKKLKEVRTAGCSKELFDKYLWKVLWGFVLPILQSGSVTNK